MKKNRIKRKPIKKLANNRKVKKRKSNKKVTVNKYYFSKSDLSKKDSFFKNYYVDKGGMRHQKPWYANFFKVGFLDDVPQRSDYDREMDGIIMSDSYYKERENNNNLYGLERLQMSINRIWNGSLRELFKYIYRIALLIGFFLGFIMLGRVLLGVPVDIPLFEAEFSDIGTLWK